MFRIVRHIVNGIVGVAVLATAMLGASAAEIPCIDGTLVYHVHPQLTVLEFVRNADDPRGVDMRRIPLPSNLGLTPRHGGSDTCDREIHTHGKQPNGSLVGHPELLHTESAHADRVHYLGAFLDLWARGDPLTVERIRGADTLILVAEDREAQFASVSHASREMIELRNDKKILVLLPLPPLPIKAPPTSPMKAADVSR